MADLDFDVAAAAERLRTRALNDDPVRPADVLAALYLYDAAVRERDELRAAAERFLTWYDSPGRSYRRDGEGSAAVAALRAALHPEDGTGYVEIVSKADHADDPEVMGDSRRG